MPATVARAAIRILRPTQSRRKLSGGSVHHQLPLELDPTDPITLSNEFDRTQSIQDLRGQLEKAGFTDIEVIPVSLETIDTVVDRLEKEMKSKQQHGQELIVFQLCDGTELDGYPGVSIIKALEKYNIPFTGSDSAFYIISSSKPVLKRELQAAQVPTSSFKEFANPPQMEDLQDIIKEITFPMIVKPSISYASINISLKSVVHTPEELLQQINESLNAATGGGTCRDSNDNNDNSDISEDSDIHRGSRHHTNVMEPRVRTRAFLPKEGGLHLDQIDIETPTVFVEKFLTGREFTALVVGDEDWGVRVYPVAERVFAPNLDKFARLLSFDQYWDGYTLEGGNGKDDGFCKYEMAEMAWQKPLQEVAKNAYLALQGSGYGRVDIRTVDMDKCEPFVLEVNANCGLSFEKDSSSLANILIMSKIAAPGFVCDLLDHALQRNKRLNNLPETNEQEHHADVLLEKVDKGFLTTEFQQSRLYIHGLQEEFLESNKLDKLEAVSGGAALALTRLEGDLQYYKSHFDKLAISYTELATKERFLGFIAEEIPLNISLEDNREMEVKAAEAKKAEEIMELSVIELQNQIKETAELACTEYDGLHQGVLDMTKALKEMQSMERALAEMKKMDDQYRGMTLEHSQSVLAAQTQQLYQLHQDIDEITSEIENLKWQESKLRERNQKLETQCIQVESQAKDAIRMNALRCPEIEDAYRSCLAVTNQYQEGVGLKSIQYSADSSSLILEYLVVPGSATIQAINSSLSSSSATGVVVSNKGRGSGKNGNNNNKVIMTQFLIKIHPKSGRLLSASIENAGCDVKDIIQIAKARNDISFLVVETLDRVMKAHP
ncbi:hypothetical protein BX616_004390 [Lobosporangium transversale]|nr:hypothetical protein BX616_004390 [Lobosporangium transversale]